MHSIENWIHTEFSIIVPTSRGNDLRVNCPFCDHDIKQHLHISVVKSVAHCFKCNWAGSHFQLVKELSGITSYAEIWAIIKDPTGKKPYENYETIADRLSGKHTNDHIEELEMPDWFELFADGVDLLHKNVLKYALSRFSLKQLGHYNIGYCNDLSDECWGRVIIPIERGYYQARTIHKNDDKKYINPEFPVGDRLFNYQALSKYNQVFITEGAISAKAIGFNAVATLGNNGANKQQRERLAQANVSAYTIAYDAGQEYSTRVLSLADYLCSHGKEVIIRKYLEGDPDSSVMFEEEEYGIQYKLQGLFSR